MRTDMFAIGILLSLLLPIQIAISGFNGLTVVIGLALIGVVFLGGSINNGE